MLAACRQRDVSYDHDLTRTLLDRMDGTGGMTVSQLYQEIYGTSGSRGDRAPIKPSYRLLSGHSKGTIALTPAKHRMLMF